VIVTRILRRPRYWPGTQFWLRAIFSHPDSVSLSILTALLLAGRGLFPIRPGVTIGSESRRLFRGARSKSSGGWARRGSPSVFLCVRSFVLGRQPREFETGFKTLLGRYHLSRGKRFAIVRLCFRSTGERSAGHPPVALAIIIGLALQSSLGDGPFSPASFSNIEAPRIARGDWIILERPPFRARSSKTNWRATHNSDRKTRMWRSSPIQRSSPKSKLGQLQRAQPKIHGASLRRQIGAPR